VVGFEVRNRQPAGGLQHSVHGSGAAGTRWYRCCCERDGVKPVDTFFALLRGYKGVSLRAPANRPARIEAGFVEEELDRLIELALQGESPRTVAR